MVKGALPAISSRNLFSLRCEDKKEEEFLNWNSYFLISDFMAAEWKLLWVLNLESLFLQAEKSVKTKRD